MTRADISKTRTLIRKWGNGKDKARAGCANNLNGNLKILEESPDDEPALNALRKNFRNLKRVIAAGECAK